MLRAQVPTLDLLDFMVLHSTFFSMLLCLQVPARSSKEDLGKDCEVAWAADYTWKSGEDKCEGSTYDKRRPETKSLKALWGMDVGSEVYQFLPFFFSAFIYHIPLGSFYFLQCFRSSEISFIAPTLCTSIPSDTSPSFPCSSVCSSPPLFPPTCPSQLYPSASHITLGGYLTYLWSSKSMAVLWDVSVPCTEWQYKGRGPRASPRLLLVHWEGGWQLWKFRNSFLVKQKCHIKKNHAQHQVALARDRLGAQQNSPLLLLHRGEWEVFLICPLNCPPGIHSAPGLSPHFWARAPALFPCFFSYCLLTSLTLIAFVPPESYPHLPMLSSRPFFLLHPANPPCPPSASAHAPKPSLCPPTPECKKFRDFRIVCAKGIFCQCLIGVDDQIACFSFTAFTFLAPGNLILLVLTVFYLPSVSYYWFFPTTYVSKTVECLF